MSVERLFLVVDDDRPADQAAQLRQSFSIAGLAGRVAHASSPSEMLEKVKKESPTLILLDHHWQEASVEKILQSLVREVPKSRVVLYTGQKINPSAVLECARSGVAEYLEKGSSGDNLAKKLSFLADDPNNTLERLAAPSGTFQQLIQEAEKTVKELESERLLSQELTREIADLRSSERRRTREQIFRFLSCVIYLVLVGVLVYIVNSFAPNNSSAMIVCLVAALAGLFVLDRSISSLFVRHGKSRFDMKRGRRG